MSHDNVELLRRGYDDAVPRAGAMEGDYRGHDGIRRWWKEFLDAFPDFTMEVVEVRDLGDVTVAAVHSRGHGAGSDPTEEVVWNVARWRRGKCVSWRNFYTEAEALEAAGLRE